MKKNSCLLTVIFVPENETTHLRCLYRALLRPILQPDLECHTSQSRVPESPSSRPEYLGAPRGGRERSKGSPAPPGTTEPLLQGPKDSGRTRQGVLAGQQGVSRLPQGHARYPQRSYFEDIQKCWV